MHVKEPLLAQFEVTAKWAELGGSAPKVGWPVRGCFFSLRYRVHRVCVPFCLLVAPGWYC